MESIDSLAKAINNFPGGLVLVSHDMRLISQVAREIWMCDNRTVTKYSGEISDFKMRIRRQMLKDNLIDGDKSLAQVPIAPLLPIAPVVVVPVKKETEEDMIRRARLELADLAIAKQRARQEAQGKSGVDVSSNAANEGVPSSEEGKVEEDEETARKRIEKETAKAKKKAEKEVIFFVTVY
jgi:hypothetical protein